MEQTLESLWSQMNVRLCRFICSRIPDGDDAEDILQEVFIRVHNRLDTLQAEEKLESWIYQIARNAITDYYRSRSRLVELIDLPVEDEPAEDDILISLGADIRQLVETLPEPYREALILTEYQGLSQKELAERLGISFSGAKSRVQRARQKIKDQLLDCCHFEFDARGLVMDYYSHCCRCQQNSC